MRLTLTGVDENTSLHDLVQMQREYKFEVGVLYSAHPRGRKRYPSKSFVNDVTCMLPRRCAVHICGTEARKQLLRGDLDGMCINAARIQVNGEVSWEELVRICQRWRSLGNHRIITQWNGVDSLYPLTTWPDNHEILVDSSGGRGHVPAEWFRPNTPKNVGFAGGLRPGNIVEEVRRISASAKGDWWIDMESSLRNVADQFDLDVCRNVALIHKSMCAEIEEYAAKAAQSSTDHQVDKIPFEHL